MGKSLIDMPHRPCVEELESKGFHELRDDEEIPGNYAGSPFICPFGLEGLCEGIRDPDYKERCEVQNPIDLLKCQLYNQFINDPDSYLKNKPVLQSEKDTVVMSGDDVVLGNSYDSVHDLQADGVDVEIPLKPSYEQFNQR